MKQDRRSTLRDAGRSVLGFVAFVAAWCVLLGSHASSIPIALSQSSPSSLFDILGSTTDRTRTLMIGYGPADNYTNTLGWQNIAENYNPHIGCRGFWGANPQTPDNPNVRVDDYHQYNADGKMLAYENTLDEWPVPGAIVRDEPSLVHAHDPARLRLLPGDRRVRVLWSDDGRGFEGDYLDYQAGRPYLRGEGVAIIGYYVQRATSPNGPFTTISPLIPYKQDTPTTHLDTGMEYLDTGLTNGTTYYYKVISREGAADLTFSRVQSVAPAAAPQPAIAIASVDVRELLTVATDHWDYTLTFWVEGNPDSVTLNFDKNRNHDIDDSADPNLDESFALTESTPGKYVFTHAQQSLHGVAYRAPGWGFFLEAQKGATTVRAPAADFYTTTMNNRSLETAFGEFIYERTSVLYRNWFQQKMERFVSPQDRCDGTFGDVVALNIQPFADALISGYNQTTWAQQYVDWLAMLDQPQLGPFVINVCPTIAELNITGPVSNKKLGQVSDGFLCEGFSVSSGTRQWTSWITGQMDGTITAMKQFHQPIFIAPRIRDDTSPQGMKDREYGVAAYNMVREERTYYYATDEQSSPFYEHPGDYPENALHLGSPVDNSTDGTVSAYVVGQGYPANGHLRRAFANGVVIMNIHQTGPFTIPLNGTYYRVEFNGGKVRAGGTLTIDPTPRTDVTLGPTEAAVFVSDPNQPPVCIENWVCTTWGPCVGGEQTRTCAETNGCQNPVGQPPLVRPCGGPGPTGGDDVGATLGLGTADLQESVVRAIRWAIGLLGILATIMVLYGGATWLLSGGDPKKIAKAKAILVSGVIGIVIVLLAWAIVSFFLNTLSLVSGIF